MKTKTISKRKQLLNELEDRFAHYSRITIEDLIVELYDPKTREKYVDAKEAVESIMKALKRRFEKQGLWFGCIDDQHNYGLANSEGEYKFGITRYYALVKGSTRRASMLSVEGKSKGLLHVRTEKLTLPAIFEE